MLATSLRLPFTRLTALSRQEGKPSQYVQVAYLFLLFIFFTDLFLFRTLWRKMLILCISSGLRERATSMFVERSIFEIGSFWINMIIDLNPSVGYKIIGNVSTSSRFLDSLAFVSGLENLTTLSLSRSLSVTSCLCLCLCLYLCQGLCL